MVVDFLAYSNEVTPMPWEGDVAAGDSDSLIRAGKHRPKMRCRAPGRRAGSRPGERWTSRRPGPHLDQNVLAS